MSRTIYIELSQMKSSASESIKNDGLFQFGTAQSREPRSLKTKTSKLCWPFNSERRILCWGLYRPPSSNMLLPSPCTAFFQSLSVNSFQWRIRDERAGIEKSIESAYLRNKESHIIGDFNIDCLKTAAYMHNAPVNSTELHPVPSPPRATAGHLPDFFSHGVGHLQNLRCLWAGHLPTPGLFPSFSHALLAVSYLNVTTRRILLKKKAD